MKLEPRHDSDVDDETIAVDYSVSDTRQGVDVSGHHGSNENSSRSVRGRSEIVRTRRTPPTLE